MCNCTTKPNFKANIIEAHEHTINQKEQYVVYNSNERLFIAPLSYVIKQNHICCYFLPKGSDGEFSEVKIEKKIEPLKASENKEVKPNKNK